MRRTGARVSVLEGAAFLLSAAVSACAPSGSAKTAGDAGSPGVPVPSVNVTHPREGALDREIALPGTVRAYQETTLYAKVAGYLKSIRVDRGDWVKQGELLAEIEVPEIQAEIGKLKAELDAAALERKRMSDAAQRAPDLVTPQAVDAARAKHEVALANLEREQTLIGYSTLRAPFAGVVTKRWLDPGAFVPAATSSSAAKNAAVVTLSDFGRVRVEVAVSEPDVPFVKAGLPAVLSVRELPGRTFAGKLTRIAYTLDESTKTMPAEIEFANADGSLRPGMYAGLKISLERKQRALLVPAEAVLMQKGKPFAFTVEAGRARKLALQTGMDDGVSVEVVGGGLSARDWVVVSGAQALSDGQACRAVEVK